MPRKTRKKDKNEQVKPSREELLMKIRRKKMEMKWARMPRSARDAETERIEDRLNEKLSKDERRLLEDRLSMLEEIEMKEVNSSGLGEFVDYSDK